MRRSIRIVKGIGSKPNRSTMRNKIAPSRRLAAWSRLLSVAAFAPLLIGCGDSRPLRVAVSGQVLIDGKPLTLGSIRFIPSDSRASQGAIDENGRFTLNCYVKGDGVVIGTHTVAVLACKPLSRTLVRWHAPKKYADATTSDIKQEISQPENDLTINLTWAGGQPFNEIVESDDSL